MDTSMTLNDWLTISAILIAPIVAVRVQKIIEAFSEARGRKLYIFKALMATRATALSPEHVQALNMIDLEFVGEKYREVTRAWRIYLDHLSSFPNGGTEVQQEEWSARRPDLLAKLLLSMGKSLGYKDFDEVHIKKAIYSPQGHGDIEMEQQAIRRGLVHVLGMESLPVHIVGVDREEADKKDEGGE